MRVPLAYWFLACGVACGRPNTPPVPPGIISSLVMSTHFDSLAILDTTMSPPLEMFAGLVNREWAGEYYDAASSALQTLRASWRSGLSLKTTARGLGLATVDSYERLNRSDGVNRVFIAFTTSAVSTDGSIAVVYWVYECGGLCGAGSFDFFKLKPDGSWEPWYHARVWVS
jgi:hypothetical protein